MKFFTLLTIIIATVCFNKHILSQEIWKQVGTDMHTSSYSNVGIGTPIPDTTLTVKGKIHTRELKVNLLFPAPDYVFKKDYDLMSLAKLEEFIIENKHLPEVPPARDLEQKGISLAEMSMILLKKAEELTLHIINNEERINKLENYLK